MTIFDVTGIHQNGKRQSKANTNVRVVCDTKQGTLTIWGTANKNTINIDKVEAQAKSGSPFSIDCDVNNQQPPKEFQAQFGHSFWVAEGNRLDIL